MVTRLTGLLCFFGMAVLWLAAVGCVRTATTVWVYDLERDFAIRVDIKDPQTNQGKISAKMPDGETLVGEYTTLASTPGNVSAGPTLGSGIERFTWAQAFGFSFNQFGKIFRVATLNGDEGTVIEMVFAEDRRVSSGHGIGRDNKGHLYRILF